MLKKEILKHILIWTGAVAGLVAVFFLMYFFLWQNNGNDSRTYDIELNDADWKSGNPEAKIVLVEYSDFQCPACAVYFSVVDQLLKDYSDDILFVYRHFPLRTIHPHAEIAAYAAEAAGRQGKFWEMYEKLFRSQALWSLEKNAKQTFLGYANELGLAETKFLEDLESNTVKEKVIKDYQFGLRIQINATPTFFLNGKKLQNPAGYEAFKKIIDSELNR